METTKGFYDEYEFLSNFYRHPIEMDSIIYPTLEHAYQASKSTILEERKKINELRSPGMAKRVGRTLTIRPDWENIKVAMMTNLVMKKFKDPKLREMLLATGDTKLVEYNTWDDKFWGVCDGIGANTLGEILMGVRESIKKGLL